MNILNLHRNYSVIIHVVINSTSMPLSSWILNYVLTCGEMAAFANKLRSLDREGRNTSSNDPKMMRSRIFIGNLAADKVSRQEVEQVFAPYGKILGVSLHKSYGFVQFDNEESAEKAVSGENGIVMHGLKLG